MKVEREAISFLNVTSFAILPTKRLSKFKNTATPDVSNCEYFLCSGSVVTITNFLNGSKPQRINILGDGSTTIANNANIITNTGANKLLTAKQSL
jgi:hypothetical protein